MERTTFDSQRTDEALVEGRADNLFTPVAHDGGERGNFEGRVHGWSAYTEAALHPKATAALAAGAALAVLAFRREQDKETRRSAHAEPAQSKFSAQPTPPAAPPLG